MGKRIGSVLPPSTEELLDMGS